MLSYKNCFLIFFFATTSLVLNVTTASAQTWGAVFPDAPNTCTQWIGTINGGSPPPGQGPTTYGYCQCQQTYSKGTAQFTNCTIKSDGVDVGAGCWNPSTGICNWCGEGGTQLIGEEACFDAGQNSGPNLNNAPVYQTWVFGISCTQNSDCISGGTSGGYSTNSDRRLKRDIAPIAVTDSGIQLYSFKYLWSDQVYVGVMAQDLLKHPQWKEAVITKQNGFYAVNYSKLGLEMTTLEQYQQHHAVASVK